MCTEWPGVLRGAIAPLGRGGNGADGGAVLGGKRLAEAELAIGRGPSPT